MDNTFLPRWNGRLVYERNKKAFATSAKSCVKMGLLGVLLSKHAVTVIAAFETNERNKKLPIKCSSVMF